MNENSAKSHNIELQSISNFKLRWPSSSTLSSSVKKPESEMAATGYREWLSWDWDPVQCSCCAEVQVVFWTRHEKGRRARNSQAWMPLISFHFGNVG